MNVHFSNYLSLCFSWYLCVGRAKKGVRRVAKGFSVLSFRRNCVHISPLATSKSKVTASRIFKYIFLRIYLRWIFRPNMLLCMEVEKDYGENL